MGRNGNEELRARSPSIACSVMGARRPDGGGIGLPEHADAGHPQGSLAVSLAAVGYRR